MQVENSYAKLPDSFYERTLPVPVSAPTLLLWNAPLAAELGLDGEWTEAEGRLARVFSGTEVLPEFDPLALAYAGHQFGHFVPSLGDGRAHLLAELVDKRGQRRDLQLKGSGPTSFSRRGDGRCALGPAVREFIMGEAMHALGVPTTRSLAVVRSGEMVQRERPLPGAIVTRVAASHLRVGTFEYFAARRDVEALTTLRDYAIERHYPGLEGEDRTVAFLDAVIERQIELVVHWMRVGFIHGVMNTDNTAISGETIDYGPCAMMSTYDPKTVFSSIDRQGRYAYGNQPLIAGWNMARLAETLLPLLDEDDEAAVAKIAPLVSGFPRRFEAAWVKMMAAKLGLQTLDEADEGVVTDLLAALEAKQLDYTVSFDRLTESLVDPTEAERLSAELPVWYPRWRTLVEDPAQAHARMRQQNPRVIPRNHHVESVLDAVRESGSGEAAQRFVEVLRSPYELVDGTSAFQDPPSDGDQNYRTFCGT